MGGDIFPALFFYIRRNLTLVRIKTANLNEIPIPVGGKTSRKPNTLSGWARTPGSFSPPPAPQAGRKTGGAAGRKPTDLTHRVWEDSPTNVIGSSNTSQTSAKSSPQIL